MSIAPLNGADYRSTPLDILETPQKDGGLRQNLTAVDDDGLTGHIAGLVTGEIEHGVGDVIGIAGVGIAGVVFGLAPTFALLVATNTLIGLAGSGYHPAASYLISRVAKPEQRGSALGVHVIGGSTSYFLAPLLAGGIAVAVGWRGTFIALSLPTLVLGVALAVLLQRAAVKRGISKTEERAAKEQ